MDRTSVWGHRSLCIVTGASQGIGRSLAVSFSSHLATDSAMLLVARSLSGLQKTKETILQNSPKLTVEVESEDLSKPNVERYKEILEKLTSSCEYDSYILVHNAGTEGNGCLTSQMADLTEWQSYLSLNLYSVTLLTSAFLQLTNSAKNRIIINITSLAAVKPIPGLGYYCVGKAAREMYFRTLAEENPQLRILSYSPGPVDTDMINRVINTLQVKETKGMFKSMKQEAKLVSLDQTTQRLVQILENNAFHSGSRIDYFDPQ